ncbi:hypothetical protein PG989_011315 [Apiospora arundinis]
MKLLKLAFCCIFFVSAASPHQSFTSIDPFWNFFDTYPYDEALHPTETTACKAALGSPGWPTDEDWANYNISIGGRLIKTSPPGAICHQDQPNYDSSRCANVLARWFTSEFHQDDPLSVMANQYANDTCLPFPRYPCSAEGYPAFVANATSAEHIKISLVFARRYNIRVVVKSSGHDFQGRSTAPGALSIWVHHMQAIETRSAPFRPQACPVTINEKTVTVAGGTQMNAVYEELVKINQTIVGGLSKTVAVLEMEVVTPMGDIVVANECQNQDLFWAMRGGGGSTFGVMTSVTMLTYPSPPMIAALLSISSPQLGTDWFWDMVGYILSQFPYLDSRGLSGYSFMNLHYANRSKPKTDIWNGGFVLLDTDDSAKMLAIWEPIFEHIRNTWPEAEIATPITAAFPSYLDYFHVAYDKGYAGLDLYAGSRLLDADSLAADSSALGQAFKVMSATYGTAFLVTGSGTRNAKPRGGGNAISHAYRRSIAYATTGLIFEPLNVTAREEALRRVNDFLKPLKKLSPGMGAYVNEDNPGNPDWQTDFWGENYERLVQIKRAVDPDDVLWCHPCVGNERWQEVGSRLCRVGGP